MLTLELSSIVLEISSDVYTTLSRNLISCLILSQEYCKLIGWYWKIMWRQLWTWTCHIVKTWQSSFSMRYQPNSWMVALSLWGEYDLISISRAHSLFPRLAMTLRFPGLCYMFWVNRWHFITSLSRSVHMEWQRHYKTMLEILILL